MERIQGRLTRTRRGSDLSSSDCFRPSTRPSAAVFGSSWGPAGDLITDAWKIPEAFRTKQMLTHLSVEGSGVQALKKL